MLIEHEGKRPTVHPTAAVAPTAVLCGDVTVGAHSWVGFGAVLTAETGPISIGRHCVIMENAVLRGTRRAPLEIGDDVLVGPHAHLSGCRLEDSAFIATAASVFPHAVVGARSAIRIAAVVHIRTVLPPGTSLPIQWIAVGDPPEFYPPDRAERILDDLRQLDFNATVFGIERSAVQSGGRSEIMERYTRALLRHRDDRTIPSSGPSVR